MMSIIQYPEAILKAPVDKSKVSEEDAHVYFLAMCTLLKTRHDGIALAANQAGFDADMFIYINNKGDFIGVLNPVTTGVSTTTSLLKEGCLSLDPTMVYPVRRHHALEVNYTEYPSMEVKMEQLAGLEAQIFQHEMDHLMGKVLLDYDTSKSP